MAIEKFGIFIAYPPTTDLRKEGLGHYLVSFLKGGSNIENVRFVVVCSSWIKEAIIELCVANQLDPDSFDLVCPQKMPVVLRLYFKIVNYKTKRARNRSRFRPFKFISQRYMSILNRIESLFLTVESFLLLILFSPLVLVFFIHYLGKFSTTFVSQSVKFFLKKIGLLLPKGILQKALNMLRNPKGSNIVLRSFNTMNAKQTNKLVQLCEQQKDVKAWYSPTAFWPEFNQIKKPSLMCVPDVVLAEFPIGFAQSGGMRFTQAFRNVENSILSAKHVVCYSEHIKQGTLIERYGFNEDRVNVVRHAPLDLSPHIPSRNGRKLGEDQLFSLSVLNDIISRGMTDVGYKSKSLDQLDYIFYASQFRPNKNVITLLSAYRRLIESGETQSKLILSGNKNAFPSVQEYIKNADLENQVLCVPGLEMHELAILFENARLAINPSLSEGGAPFTFTEALSVGTPIVMARIPVTLEVISNPSLDDRMFFDPYSVDDLAKVLLYGLENSKELLELQQPVFNKLSLRTWRMVVEEHIQVLRNISEPIQ